MDIEEAQSFIELKKIQKYDENPLKIKKEYF